MEILEKIQALKENETCSLANNTAEVLLKYETYLLFSIPLYGGRPCFEGAFEKHQIAELISKIESLT